VKRSKKLFSVRFIQVFVDSFQNTATHAASTGAVQKARAGAGPRLKRNAQVGV